MSDVSQVLRSFGGATSTAMPAEHKSRVEDVDPQTLHRVFASMLDGGTSDLETGALIGAAAVVEGARDPVKYAPLLLALMEVVQERVSPLAFASPTPIVVLPNYADTFTRPQLSLLALLLQRIGVKVLLHGAIETKGGLFTAGVLREFGVLPAATRGQATRQLAEDGIAILPTSLYSPGLAEMLSLRNRLGISTPGHHLASLLVSLVDQPSNAAHVLDVAAWLRPAVDSESSFMRAPALMTVRLEAESAVPPAPMILYAEPSRGTWTVLYGTEERRTVSNALFTGVPDAWDAKAWAAWTRRLLEGKSPLPSSLLHMLAACLFACGYARDMNEAKAVAAVAVACSGGSGLAAA